MATAIQWVSSGFGTNPLVKEYRFDSSLAGALAGTPVVFDVSEDALVAATVANVDALGILLEDIVDNTFKTYTADLTLVQVLLPTPGDIFRSSWSAGATANDTTSTADIGRAVEIIRRTSPTADVGKWTLVEATTNPWAVIVDIDPREEEGVSGGHYLFRFIQDIFNLGSQA